MQKNDKDLEKYIFTFLGYGNTNANYWHIGKEEAGEAKDIDARLKAWIKLGSSRVVDNYKFHLEFANQKRKPKCYASLFNEQKTNLQKTWAGQIKLQLAIKTNQLLSLERLKKIQSKEFGRSDSTNAILELFPLPAPNHDKHNYQASKLPYLKDKKTYKEEVVKKRIQLLKSLIFDKKPKFVIFYSTGKDFIKYWKQITGDLAFKTEHIIPGRSERSRYLLLDKKEGITFGITQHPTYTGTSDKELLETGKLIKDFSEKE